MAIRHRNDKLPGMPSSNFLRRRWPVYLALAIALGSVSPAIGQWFDFMDASSRRGLLYWWFMGVPAEVYAWIGAPERYQHWIWSGLFTLQYLVVFAASAGAVMLLQRRVPANHPAAPPAPPERARAFETAAAVYCQADVSDFA
jgi:hypothetical protein